MAQQQLYPHLNKQGDQNYYVYTDSSNNIVLSGEYSFATPFKGEYAVANKNKKTGVINKQGQWVLSPKFSNVEIMSVGDEQLFMARTYYDTNYEFYRWKIFPEFSLGLGGRSSVGPFLGTKVAYTQYQIFDKNGKEIFSLRLRSGSRYSSYSSLSDFPNGFYMKESKLVIVDGNKNRLLIYEQDKKGGFKQDRVYKQVCGIVDNGFLVYQPDKKQAFFYNYDGKRVSDKPYEFLQSTRWDALGEGDKMSIWLNGLWKYQDKYYCVNDINTPLIPVSSEVVAKTSGLLLPLDPAGELFWVNMCGDHVGVIAKDGTWVHKVPNGQFVLAYNDGSILYKDTVAKGYYYYTKDGLYEFPKEATPDRIIEGDKWMMIDKERDERDNRVYSVYDIKLEKIVVKRGVYLSYLGNGYYMTENKVYKESGGYDLKYEIVDSDRTVISKGDYRRLSKTDDSEFVLVTPRDESGEFYVRVATGEELK